MTISIVIPTYGDPAVWAPLSRRAELSALHQSRQALEVVTSHGSSLADARNKGAVRARGEWLIFLDADDELGYHYVEAMESVEGDVRRPATLGIADGVEDNEAVMIPRKPLITGNFIVIGAMIERERFMRLGRFDELPILEDWDLWLRFERDGATIVDVPDAVYRVHVRSGSRNADPLHHQVYNEIRRRYQ